MSHNRKTDKKKQLNASLGVKSDELTKSSENAKLNQSKT